MYYCPGCSWQHFDTSTRSAFGQAAAWICYRGGAAYSARSHRGISQASSDTPLMEAGVDSLAATELATRLRNLSGVALSPTLMFEQPSPRAIASHLVDQLAEAGQLVTPVARAGASPTPQQLPSVSCTSSGTKRWALQPECGNLLGTLRTGWGKTAVPEAAVRTSVISSVAARLRCVLGGNAAITRGLRGARGGQTMQVPGVRPTAISQQAFAWRQPKHPFAQLRLPQSDKSSITYRSHAAGSLHTVASDHVVQGRVIFPGVGYLELLVPPAQHFRALAQHCAACSSCSQWRSRQTACRSSVQSQEAAASRC